MKTLEFTNLDELEYHVNEALNSLCTNLTFASANSIVFTSRMPNEGKSFTTINVARVLAGMNYSVVLVDSDLRKSVLNANYGVKLDKGDMGLAHYLSQQCEVEDVIYATNVENMYFIPCGAVVKNSHRLLSNGRLEEMMVWLSKNFNFVLVDAAPCGLVADPLLVAQQCDGALVVVDEGGIRKKDLVAIRQQIEMAGCPVLGVVFNKKKIAKKQYGQYYYGGDHSK